MWSRRVAIMSVFGVWTIGPSVALADPSSCAAAYEKAQEDRSDGRLRAARRQLELCVAADCPDFIRADCGRWLSEVEAASPSIVLAAKAKAKEVDDVRVSLDGEPLTNRLDGKAVMVDPGRHTLVFVHLGSRSVTLELTIREGEKNRLVTADLGGGADNSKGPSSDISKGNPPPEREALAASAKTPSRGFLPYAIAGIGLAGMAGFAALGLAGNSEKADLEKSCAPTCADADVARVRTKYNLADLSLGVGVVALGVAAYLFWTAPAGSGSSHPEAPKVSLDVEPVRGGGLASVAARF